MGILSCLTPCMASVFCPGRRLEPVPLRPISQISGGLWGLTRGGGGGGGGGGFQGFRGRSGESERRLEEKDEDG